MCEHALRRQITLLQGRLQVVAGITWCIEENVQLSRQILRLLRFAEESQNRLCGAAGGFDCPHELDNRGPRLS